MKPLQGIKVIDLTNGNPYIGSLFADYGAEVVKIENPVKGDDVRRRGSKDGESEGVYQNYYGRGKLSVGLDWRSEEGADVVRRMIPNVDMICANEPESALARFGLGYEQLKALNPKLVYGVLTPFGEEGPWKDYPDYDLVVMARGALLERTGLPEKPTRIGFPLAYYYGSWHLTAGMLAAFFASLSNGEGRKVSVSCWHAIMSVDETDYPCMFGLNVLPVRIGNGFPTTNPTDTFRCKNGWFSLSIGSDQQWHSFSREAGRQDWIDDPRYSCDPARSLENYFGDLDQQLKDFFMTITIEEADRICRAAMVPGAPCNTVRELVDDEQTAVRGMLKKSVLSDGREALQIGYPIKFSGSSESDYVVPSADALGAHTKEILEALAGVSEDEFKALNEKAVV